MHSFHDAFSAPNAGNDTEAKQLPAKRRITLKTAVFGVLLLASVAAQAESRLTDLQYLGSHNSYHAGFAPSEAALLKQHDPAAFATLDYRHPPLTQQLNDGVRQLELDVLPMRTAGVMRIRRSSNKSPRRGCHRHRPARPPAS